MSDRVPDFRHPAVTTYAGRLLANLTYDAAALNEFPDFASYEVSPHVASRGNAMKRPVILLLLGLVSSTAWAECYTVYDRANRIVYRDVRTPIDLSGPIGEAMRAWFPGGHLVIGGGPRGCTPIDPQAPVDPMSGAAGRPAATAAAAG
jgi:hypothetical protein